MGNTYIDKAIENAKLAEFSYLKLENTNIDITDKEEVENLIETDKNHKITLFNS